MPVAEHLAKLIEGTEAWNQWRQDHASVFPDLSFAYIGIDLRSIDFQALNLREIRQQAINLNQADLSGSDLMAATLPGAQLRKANLAHTNLRFVYLFPWSRRLER
jgi:uncharacterized protein YjbI with pentapeptide repeats